MSDSSHRTIENVLEFKAFSLNGFFVLLIWLLITAMAVLSFIAAPRFGLPLSIVSFIMVTGFSIVQPNEAKAVIFFGNYKGSLIKPGFLWTWPLSLRRRVSLRLINFDSDALKVNDLRGNPVEIGAVVVWRAVDSAKAVFNVDDYIQFVHTQAETALRAIATYYAYDAPEDQMSLRGNGDDVADALKKQLQDRLDVAGIVIEETRISHLAYAPEIAAAMLKRQQAEAVISARRFIVENAIGMVDDVMDHFAKSDTVTLDDDRKATMIGNLLVALVAERDAEPVIRVG